MKRFLPLLAAVGLIAFSPAQVSAQDREMLGTARLFNNDVIGDGRDRWQSGGYGVSRFRGPEWTGTLPTRPFDILEYRVRADIRAPDNLNNPAPGDRLYAATWWIGVHTHFDWHGFDVASGLDVAITGEQSGLRSFQQSIHDTFSMPRVNIGSAQQVDDGFFLHGTLEVARDIEFEMGAVRPFLELQGGVETLARAGVDVTFGSLGSDGLRTRDPVTGQRVSGITDTRGGWSGLFGADFAYVHASEFFPTNRGPTLEDTRTRVRAGVNYGIGTGNLFYGVTYLSEEFVGQSEGQMVGSLTLDFRF